MERSIDLKRIDDTTRNHVVKIINENWGSPIIVTKGKVHNAAETPGFIAVSDGQIVGLLTYHIANQECEIVLLESFAENIGTGGRLLQEVQTEAEKCKCRRLWLITTNDNTKAIRFYQKRGFDMAALYRNAVDQSRKLKPEIPLFGYDEIPILHEIEFEKVLR